MYVGLHLKCLLFLSGFNENRGPFRRFFVKSPSMKFHENTSGGNRIIPCGWTNGEIRRSW